MEYAHSRLESSPPPTLHSFRGQSPDLNSIPIHTKLLTEPRSDVDLPGRQFRVLDVKDSEYDRWVPKLSPERDPDLVFNLFKHFMETYPTKECPFAICQPDTLTHWLKRWMTEASCGQFYLHCTRHSFITYLLSQGIPVRVVQRLVGHRQITTTIRYAHEDTFPNGIKVKY